MRQSRTILLMGATALVAAVAGFEARRGPAAQPAHAAPPPVVETVQPSSGSVDVTSAALHNMDLHLARVDLQPLVRIVQATGVVAFNDLRMAQLSPPARGRIQSIEVAVGQPVVLTRGHGPLFEATRDSAVRALLQAQPYSMLSLTTYDQWKEIDINFDPREVFGG